MIGYADRSLNFHDDPALVRRRKGTVAIVLIVLIAAGCGLVVHWVFSRASFGWMATALVASSLVAQRSLATHVRAVAESLQTGGVEAGRQAVAEIVGRDTTILDESGVSRAAIESLAENFSDGVVAPVFWLAVGGLPGIAAYKAINTADSMIGHKSEKHLHFGRTAALVDDLVNLPASRLTAILVIAAATFTPGASPKGAWRAMRRDSSRHRSPNAGWPEAAFAGALGLELAGPRHYNGEIVNDAIMGEGGVSKTTAMDIRRALTLFWIADLLLVAAIGLIAVLLYGHL